MTEIAKYTVGVDFDLKWRKLDKNLKLLEKRLSKFSGSKGGMFSIDRFAVDQIKLNRMLGQALDRASLATTFSIDRFNIDQAALTRQMTRALRAATAAASGSANINPDVNSGVGRGGITSRHAGIAGGVGGLAARAYMPLLAVAGGGYGLAQLNKRNQEVVAAQLQTQAVIMGNGGTKQQGVESFEWLKKQADRVGFNYLDAASDYNILTSNLMGAGGSIEDSQRVFKGFAEYGRVNKLSGERQKLVFNALSQIAGKDKLQAEELTKQLGNSLPGAKDIFAQAWQKRVGGNLTGNEAIQALEAAMKKGNVRGDILALAADIASERSQKGLSAASQASQAEQDRFRNAYNELAILASDNGVESGFARLFRALTDGAKESLPLVKGLAGAFDEVTKYAAVALLTFQDIQRFFQGRDSLIGDTLLPDKESQEAAFLFLERYKGLWKEIRVLMGNVADGWKMLASTINWGTLLQGAGAFFSVLQNLFGALNAAVSGDYSEAGKRLLSAATTATTPVRTVADAAIDAAAPAWSTLGAIYTLDPSLLGKRPPSLTDLGTSSGLDYKTEQQAQLQMAAAENAKNGFPNVTGVMPMKPSETTVTVNVYDAHDVDKISAVIQQVMEDTFRSVNVDNPNQE